MRGAGGVVGILGEGTRLEKIGGGQGRGHDIRQAQAFVFGRKDGEQLGGATEEAGGRTQASAMDAVGGFAAVVLQVNVAAGELDEGLVKNMALALGVEPKVLEHVVRLVIFLRVEETEVIQVAGMEAALMAPPRHAGGDARVFAHADQAASRAAWSMVLRRFSLESSRGMQSMSARV
jgi:hypothetical protein